MKSLKETFFKEIGNFETFISEFTVAEIERTPDTALRSKMKEAVSLLTLTDDVEVIANEYLRHGAVPNRNYDTCRIAIGVKD